MYRHRRKNSKWLGIKQFGNKHDIYHNVLQKQMQRMIERSLALTIYVLFIRVMTGGETVTVQNKSAVRNREEHRVMLHEEW